MERRKNGIDTVVGERYIGNIAFSFDDTAYTKNSWKNSAFLVMFVLSCGACAVLFSVEPSPL